MGRSLRWSGLDVGVWSRSEVGGEGTGIRVLRPGDPEGKFTRPRLTGGDDTWF